MVVLREGWSWRKEEEGCHDHEEGCHDPGRQFIASCLAACLRVCLCVCLRHND